MGTYKGFNEAEKAISKVLEKKVSAFKKGAGLAVLKGFEMIKEDEPIMTGKLFLQTFLQDPGNSLKSKNKDLIQRIIIDTGYANEVNEMYRQGKVYTNPKDSRAGSRGKLSGGQGYTDRGYQYIKNNIVSKSLDKVKKVK